MVHTRRRERAAWEGGGMSYGTYVPGGGGGSPYGVREGRAMVHTRRRERAAWEGEEE